MLELQAELDEKLMELTHAHDQLKQASEAGDKLREANEGYVKKLEELSNVQSFRDEQYRAQLHTQEKLIHLYKVCIAPQCVCVSYRDDVRFTCDNR